MSHPNRQCCLRTWTHKEIGWIESKYFLLSACFLLNESSGLLFLPWLPFASSFLDDSQKSGTICNAPAVQLVGDLFGFVLTLNLVIMFATRMKQ